MHFKHLAVSSAAALALGLCGAASASVINFDQANANTPDGTVSYDGAGGALTGSGISFGEVRFNGGSTPGDHQNTLTCNSCSINFTTGKNLSEGNEDQIWTFAGGGNLTLSGQVVDKSGKTVADGKLFTGTFDNGGTQVVISNGSDSFNASLSGKDDFNGDLASYFGLNSSTGLDFSSTEIALGKATFGGDGSFNSGQLQNADVSVKSNDVPEPSPFGIFAVGLALVAGGLGFRRKQHGRAA